MILLTQIQDDDSEIRSITASVISKLLFPEDTTVFCENYCLEAVLKLLKGSVELNNHYKKELGILLNRLEFQNENEMFEMESPNLYREFNCELYFLSPTSQSKPSHLKTLETLIEITKPSI